MCKLRAVCDILGEFGAHIVCFWHAQVGWNHSINTKFTKHIMEIADSTHESEKMETDDGRGRTLILPDCRLLLRQPTIKFWYCWRLVVPKSFMQDFTRF